MKLFKAINELMKVKIFSDIEEDQEKTKEYKILILGDKSVGKTSICNRFCLNEFSLEIKSSTTNEAYLKVLKMFDEFIHLYIIDTVETIMSLDRKELYSDVDAVIIVFDTTKVITFEKVDKWILDVKQLISPNLPIILLGHKNDMNFIRNVEFEEGLEKAKRYKCEYFESNCLDDNSIDDIFKYIVARLFYNALPDTKKKYFKMIASEKLDNDDLKSIKSVESSSEIDQISSYSKK